MSSKIDPVQALQPTPAERAEYFRKTGRVLRKLRQPTGIELYVRGVFLSNGSIMFFRRHMEDGTAYYYLPGGGLELGETREAGLKRELREEIEGGETILTGTNLRTFEIIYQVPKGQETYTRHEICFVYVIYRRTADRQVDRDVFKSKSADGSRALCWISTRDLSKMNIQPPEVKEWLVDQYAS